MEELKLSEFVKHLKHALVFKEIWKVATKYLFGLSPTKAFSRRKDGGGSSLTNR